MNIIVERIQRLRDEMKKRDISFYIVPTSDYHFSEYVGDFFKCRAYITGFTGSAGTAVITLNDAYLWTDGRYFLQAEEQLKGTSVTLCKQGEKGVPTIVEFLKSNAKNTVIGFDGKVISGLFTDVLKKELSENNVKFYCDEDLIDIIWKDRPALSKTEAYTVDIKYTGESRKSKLLRVEEEIKKFNCDGHIICSLDDIAWILNIRADDVKYNPVLLSYLAYYKGQYTLYVNPETLSNKVRKELENDGIEIKGYNDLYKDVEGFKGRIVLDKQKVNYLLQTKLSHCELVNHMNFSFEMKAIKNEVEIENNYNAHIKDGVAVTKFIYWLKKNVGKIPMTEISCADYLENLRKQNDNFKGLSFETISGYDYHGAIIHYDPTKETDIPVLPKSFLLVDSGAQYLEGTTDITRTISLGELSDEQRLHYTLVLKGHLNLGNAVFKEGVSGCTLDMLARKPLWEYGVDYNHGTGHGVGQFLNVHEGPQNISNSPMRCGYPFKAGMITSDEPGIYIRDKYGIRIENLMVCKEKETNDFGKFLCFDFLTVVPYDVEAIKVELLTEEEKKILNNYHQRVYNTLERYLTKDEKEWLQTVTREI